MIDSSKQWSKFFFWDEYHYNTNHHSAIGMTLFRTVYGRLPPSISAYTRGTSLIEAVEEDLLCPDAILQKLQNSLHRSQNRMRQQANKKTKDIKVSGGLFGS
jgi:hypothetical protein